jgi:hypothetical protein
MWQHDIDVNYIQITQNLIVDAHQKSLPTGPMINKAHEGLSKNIPGQYIVKAVENVRDRYSFSYDQIQMITNQKRQKDQLAGILASSIAAGMRREDAIKIVTTLKDKSHAIKKNQFNSLALESLITLRDLSRVGVSSESATQMVAQVLQKQYSGKQMKNLRGSFISQSRHTSPQNLAEGFTKAIQEGRSTDGIGGSRSGGRSGTSGGSGGSGGSGSSEGSSGGGGSEGAGGGSSGGGGSGGGGGGSGGSGAGGGGGSRR